MIPILAICIIENYSLYLKYFSLQDRLMIKYFKGKSLEIYDVNLNEN